MDGLVRDVFLLYEKLLIFDMRSLVGRCDSVIEFGRQLRGEMLEVISLGCGWVGTAKLNTAVNNLRRFILTHRKLRYEFQG